MFVMVVSNAGYLLSATIDLIRVWFQFFSECLAPYLEWI